MVVAGHRGLATGLAGLEKAAEQEARSKLSENYELIAKVRIHQKSTSLMTFSS